MEYTIIRKRIIRIVKRNPIIKKIDVKLNNIYNIEIENRVDKKISLKKYKNKVILIVNTATGYCFTPQYEGLESLYKKYHDIGLKILDFQCNQFGHQAPGTDDEIHDFCTAKYKTTFDQMKKIDVNGEEESNLYKYLKHNSPTKYINGTKNLSVRKWECSKCHSINDRDINASVNILMDGIERYYKEHLELV